MHPADDKKNSHTEEPVDAEILLIEDDPDDAMIVERALHRAPIKIRTRVFSNGRAALDYLEQSRQSHAASNEVSLILLDLNMPLMDGHEFLRIIRADERFKSIPVVVLTTSRETEIIQRAYRDGASAVISKVDTLDGMMTVVDTIVRFWFQTAQRFLLD